MSSTSSASISAVKRLQHDLKELQKNPVENVFAQPIGVDLFKWSVNMVAEHGPWAGVPVHLHMTFPNTYPDYPPTIEMVTNFDGHSNVFEDYICLDMLKPPEYYSRPYRGWSSTYTISALLTQLYGFLLMDDTILQDYGDVVDRTWDANSSFRVEALQREAALEMVSTCSCGMRTLPSHCGLTNDTADGVVTAASTRQHARGSSRASSTARASQNSTLTGTSTSITRSRSRSRQEQHDGLDQLTRLDDPVLRLILSHLEPQDLWRCQRGGGRLARLARDTLQRSEQVCFHTKLPHSQVLLGFGISRTWHHTSSNLRSLSTRSDYLSAEAFQAGVRRSAWNVPFDAFLPMYLNPEHGHRALQELPAYLHGLMQRTCTTGRLPAKAPTLQPQTLLTVLAQLMNSLVVELVTVKEEECRGTQQMSDAALQTFCHLHHLLLAVALQPDSGLVGQALSDVTRFVNKPDARHKDKCPDLGILLIEYLLVPKSQVPWAVFAPVFLRELLARQVRWIIQSVGPGFGQPYGEHTNPTGSTRADYDRLRTHFLEGGTGLRLVMLQAWFANALARPSTPLTCLQELGQFKAAYDECSGLPPQRVFEAFNRHARGVMQCGSCWSDFLEALRVGTTAERHPRGVWVSILRQAVVDSFNAGYHKQPNLFVGGVRELRGFMNWEDQQPLGVVREDWV